jgi:hypothetical protein
MHAAACATTKGRYDSSLSKCIASYYPAIKSGVVKRLYSILSAVSGASSGSAITFRSASASAVSLSVVVKITEHSLEYGRKSAKPSASLVDKPPPIDYTVVPSALSKINKHCRVLTSATQRFTTCFISTWSSLRPGILSFCATFAYD